MVSMTISHIAGFALAFLRESVCDAEPTGHSLASPVLQKCLQVSWDAYAGISDALTMCKLEHKSIFHIITVVATIALK